MWRLPCTCVRLEIRIEMVAISCFLSICLVFAVCTGAFLVPWPCHSRRDRDITAAKHRALRIACHCCFIIKRKTQGRDPNRARLKIMEWEHVITGVVTAVGDVALIKIQASSSIVALAP